MKSFLIKIGKAINVLKRDGAIKGLARIATAFFALFGRVGVGDILFVTNGVGDSARYRAHHVAEELELHGFKCSVTVQDNPWLSSYADKFKIFIFHRVLFTSSVAKLIKKIKKQEKEIIFDADDLVFDPKYIREMDYFKDMNRLEKKLYENGLGGEILNDPYVKICTTTTAYLAQKLHERGKKVFIVPNKLSNKDLEIVGVILSECKRVEESNSNKIRSLDPPRRIRDDNKVRIGYFSGTISHNKDFAAIADTLVKIMEKHANVELVLAGPLDIESKLNKFKDRIRQSPYVPRGKYFSNIAGVDINLAPLEMGNPFCEAKSELKFFETGILEIPTVAAANQTFRGAITDGADGFLAGAEKEWEEKIGLLIENENLRREMGRHAWETALTRYTNKNSDNKEYYNYLRSRII